jgi:predicted transposase YbfD/YdcC
VGSKENEVPAMKRLLGELLLKGHVVTMDALLTHKDIARQIVLKEGISSDARARS